MDFIVVSTADWDNKFWTNKQHNSVILSKMGHRVLYIDSLGLRKPTATVSDANRIIKKIKRMLSWIRKVDNNIWVMAPISLPWHGNILVDTINNYLLKYSIKTFIIKKRFKNIILWTYSPIVGSLCNSNFFDLKVYNCVDNIAEQPGMPKEFIQKKEIELSQEADFIFVTSHELYKEKKKINSNTYYFSNVADFNHFSKARNQHKFTIPSDIKYNNKIKVGFVGAISSYKVDFLLIYNMAKEYSNIIFYLIGKVGEGEPNTDVSLLKKLENIVFLGSKEYNELPRYIAFFDVCILPCNLNSYTKSMFPMKFFEYLAAGKPVVSTRLDSIKEYDEYCYFADDYKEFAFKIIQAYNENNELKMNFRQALAKKYTYENRMKKMLSIITK